MTILVDDDAFDHARFSIGLGTFMCPLHAYIAGMAGATSKGVKKRSSNIVIVCMYNSEKLLRCVFVDGNCRMREGEIDPWKIETLSQTYWECV